MNIFETQNVFSLDYLGDMGLDQKRTSALARFVYGFCLVNAPAPSQEL